MDSVSNITSTEYPVYIGFWTNWSQGKVLGSSLTLTRSDGNLLISFIAFFLTIIVSHLWSIICFFLHLSLSSREPRGPLHHQRQAILRNNPGPSGTAWTLIQVAWIWRRRGVIRKIIPLLLATSLVASGLAIATAFSARIATGSEVLISGSNCGIVVGGTNTSDNGMVILPWEGREVEASASYAQQCYSEARTSLVSMPCRDSPFVRQELPFSVDLNADCPFDPSLCRSNNSNIILDTGLIDSLYDLGMNTPPEDRLLFRKVLQCAPLITEGYKKDYIYSDDRSYTRYYYGEPLWFLRPISFIPANVTYEYPTDISNRTDITDLNYAYPDYTLEIITAYSTNGTVLNDSSSMFNPMPQLRRNDADVFVLFLSTNTVRFSGTHIPTDPWYYPNQTEINDPSFNWSDPYLIPAVISFEPASPLACAYQEQYCRPDGGGCTELGSSNDAIDASGSLFQDNQAYTNFEWLGWAGTFGLEAVIRTLRSHALTSRFGLYLGLQGQIPGNQWQLDVQYWLAISLAAMQRAVTVNAAGALPNDEAAIWRPSNDSEINICQNQKIVSPAHVTFSVFGLGFLGAFGLLIIITSFSIEPITSCVQRRWKLNPYRRLEWVTNNTLQLQRLAQEELGLGEWSRCDESIPLVTNDVHLAHLDVSDEKHPVLQVPNKIVTSVVDHNGAGVGQEEVSLRDDSSNSRSDTHIGVEDDVVSAEDSDSDGPAFTLR
ncbi:hypothetical protein M426DRAFT_255537 [Hypoxylon sp. CI-4A]|nr:hypothetical protein M426DRAFT_255537 [Hypoxylon sp. CI-4A]